MKPCCASSCTTAGSLLSIEQVVEPVNDVSLALGAVHMQERKKLGDAVVIPLSKRQYTGFCLWKNWKYARIHGYGITFGKRLKDPGDCRDTDKQRDSKIYGFSGREARKGEKKNPLKSNTSGI